MGGDHRTDGGKVGQSVGDQMDRGMQRRIRPGGVGRAREIGDCVEAHMLRMAFRVALNGSRNGALFSELRSGLPL